MENLTGSIDLLKLNKTGIATIKGVKCLVIPVQENDIFISADEDLKPKAAYLGLNVYARKEASQYGKTHYVKQSFSKEYREAYPQQVQDKPFLGDMKPFVFENRNAAETVDAPEVSTEDDSDNLPF